MKPAVTVLAPIFILFGLQGCSSTYSNNQAANTSSEGARLFEENCQRCHRYADDLKEPESFLKKTIHQGSGEMPSFQGVLTEKEEILLSKYLSNI